MAYNESTNVTQITDEKRCEQRETKKVGYFFFSDFGIQCQSNDEATGYKRHRFSDDMFGLQLYCDIEQRTEVQTEAFSF